MKRIVALLAATLIGMVAWAELGPDTIKDDIPGTATVREIVEAGGGGGVSVQTVTNIASRVTSNIVTKAYVEGLGISGGAYSVMSNATGEALVKTLRLTDPSTAKVIAKDNNHNDFTLIGFDGRSGEVLGGQADLGVYSLAIAPGAYAKGIFSIAIGHDATAGSARSVAIGDTSTSGDSSVAIGCDAATGHSSVAIGNRAAAEEDSVALGAGTAVRFDSVAIGGLAAATNLSIALGWYAVASNDLSTVIGSQAHSHGNETVNIGRKNDLDYVFIGDRSVGEIIDTVTNATLAAANAYTDAHAGTGGLSTNAVLALIEDSVGGTNAVRAAVAHTAVGPTWMRPNAWRLTSTPTRDVAEIAAVYYTTNNFRSYSNEVARVITTRSAQLRGERLDRYAVDPLIVTNFAAVTPGCSVDELGYVTAEADGQYRFAGTDSTGETRYCDIWFSAGIRDTVLNTIYVGDLAPHLAAANDAALGVLDAAALVGTYTVAGKTCNQYSTFSLPWAKSGAHGYYNPWAVSGHILMTAGHLGYMGDRGPITYGSTTLDRGHAYWLKDWALEHGFTPAEVNAVSMIGDIELIVCTGGPIPATDLPTFISPEKFAARFPGGLNGAVVWSANQHHADMVPRVVIDSHGHTFAGDDRWAGYSARADLAAILAAMGQQHIFHGGDSGHVVFLRDDGEDIPLTQYYYASGGPDLVAAYPMLKAFVESFGDTLKEVE